MSRIAANRRQRRNDLSNGAYLMVDPAIYELQEQWRLDRGWKEGELIIRRHALILFASYGGRMIDLQPSAKRSKVTSSHLLGGCGMGLAVDCRLVLPSRRNTVRIWSGSLPFTCFWLMVCLLDALIHGGHPVALSSRLSAMCEEIRVDASNAGHGL